MFLQRNPPFPLGFQFVTVGFSYLTFTFSCLIFYRIMTNNEQILILYYSYSRSLCYTFPCSRVSKDMGSSCLFSLFWALTVAQTLLVSMTLTVWRRTGQVFYRLPGTGICLVFLSWLDLALKKQITEVKCFLFTIYQEDRLLRKLLTYILNFGHLAEVVFVKFSHRLIFFPCPSCVCYLGGSHNAEATLEERGVSFTSLMDS